MGALLDDEFFSSGTGKHSETPMARMSVLYSVHAIFRCDIHLHINKTHAVFLHALIGNTLE